MTELQTAMCFLMEVFDRYAAGDGNKNTLSKAETKKLLTEQFPDMMKAAKSPQEVEKLLTGLDLNGDAEVEFNEFMMIVGMLTCAIHHSE